MRLAELQQKAVSAGASVQDFNTFASSIGFPPRRAFEKALSARFRR
jgi:hypothetical protein